MNAHLRIALFLAFFAFAGLDARAQAPLGTAFTYQGELASDGAPATGTYDIRFRLFDAATGSGQVGSTLCADNLTVTSGRFAASLDFGNAAFNGQKRFLEIEVRQDTGLDCSDATGYTVLTPRQELTATPNATFALTAATATNASNAASLNGQAPSFYQNAANLTGTLADTQLSNNIARLDGNQTFTGVLSLTNPGNTFVGSGAGLPNLNGGNISSGSLARSSLNDDLRSGVGSVVLDLSLASSVATAATPYSVTVSGSFAYVVAKNSNRLQIFNISNPSAPALVGSVVTGSSPYFVAVSGSHAYVVNFDSSTLQVFNVSNPAAPTLAGTVATGGEPTAVAVSGSYAYVAHVEAFSPASTMRVFDVSNPAAPTQVGSISTGGRAYSLAASGGYVYLVDHVQMRLRVYDVSNPGVPFQVASVPTASFPTSVAVSGSFAYVVCGSGNQLQIFNISNPMAPTLVGQAATASQPWCVSVSGPWAYAVCDAANVLQVFNVSNPAVPTLAGQIATGVGPNSVAASGSLAYVVNRSSSTLQVFSGASGVGFTPRIAGSSLTGVNGGGLTGVNAAQLNGQAASFYTNASNLTAGTLANAQTTGTSLNTPNTLVLRDASGNFSAGTITATLNGNAATATTATNATQLNSQPASFYTNAANLASGILDPARVPGLDASKITTGTFAASRIPSLDASIITAGTLANARTTGTNLNTASTLVLRDASGNFSAGTITAALNGSATQLNGQPASFYTNAANIAAGTLDNARTTGTNLSTASTLVLRDASGNFSAGTITAALNGNATSATNATQLNGQPASFYTNASNITSGTISPAVLPATSWTAASLPPNILNPTTYTTILGTSQTLPMRAGVAVVNWSVSGYSTANNTGFGVRVRAGSNTGPVTVFYFNLGAHAIISGNAIIPIPTAGNYPFSLEIIRLSGGGNFASDSNDSLTATIINLGQ